MEEKQLMKNSYSSMDTFCTCPMRYDLTYNKKLRSTKTTIALQMGSIAHKCFELAVMTKQGKANYTYEQIIDILENGWKEPKTEPADGEDKGKEELDGDLAGIKEIQQKYFDEYIENNYSLKIITFKHILKSQFIEDGWKPLATEQEFRFVFRDKCEFHGFIDRVDINENGDLRVVDYKTSKKVYDNKKLNHSMQMGVYKNACLALYGKVPVEYMYHFIFLDETQLALTGKYLDKIDNEIDDVLDTMQNNFDRGIYEPKPTPLCYWCPYTGSSPLADDLFGGMCQYYSKWTPTNKTFAVNKKYEEKPYSANPVELRKDLIW